MILGCFAGFCSLVAFGSSLGVLSGVLYGSLGGVGGPWRSLEVPWRSIGAPWVPSGGSFAVPWGPSGSPPGLPGNPFGDLSAILGVSFLWRQSFSADHGYFEKEGADAADPAEGEGGPFLFSKNKKC